jgi:hypothetical protein
MTPKEKAEDLFDMFNSKNDILFHQLDKEGAKQCALIVVSEILDELSQIDDGQTYIPYIYWEQVKEEIEKL